MFNLVLALAPVAIITISSELLWRAKVLRGEKARKFIHILSGIWIAFWPYYLPFDGVFILGCLALTVILYSKATRLFHAIYAVKRRTYGDVLFPIAIIFCAYLGVAEWVFTLSILLMAFSDGVAALVGSYLSKNNVYYKVFGLKSLRKSTAGTTAYIIASYVCIGVVFFTGGSEAIRDNMITVLLVLPMASAALENTMPYGLDNIAVPLFCTVLLNSLV